MDSLWPACTHSRLHGSDSYRVPWLFDEESVEVLRRFTRLKAQLMPYIYGHAVAAARDGLPVLPPMVAEFPDDPACTHLDRQYMFGDRLLVAPVFSASGEASYYIPAGTWTHLQTGATVRGPAWVREVCDFLTVPVFVRPGTVLPIGAETTGGTTRTTQRSRCGCMSSPTRPRARLRCRDLPERSRPPLKSRRQGDLDSVTASNSCS
jgi:alpha-glucosidase (family GH31 glycosyl hydrolase)